MRCPFCSGMDNRVVDSRVSREGRAVRRRRECVSCKRRFTTYEYVEERPIMVVKRDGSTEVYDRRKVFQSVARACAKRPISTQEIDDIVDAIEDGIARRSDDEVESLVIGELVMAQLKAKDHVAYVRFASVYRNFQDLEEFYEELRDLSARRMRAAQRKGQVELPLSDAS
ncbi:MAG: transcriptional regulator NrdR [Gemmatimonadetes bacterium]|nr:transcriptional regulator NrdR [Gemmatimonadota bacterium]